MINQTFYILGRLKDPFPPARIAAINALAATQQFYTLAETSGRVVPILCPLMSDPEKPVREQAFKVSFLNYLFTYQGGLGGLTGLGGKLSTLAELCQYFNV